MATKRNFRAMSMSAASPKKDCKSRRLTSKILKEAYAQQKEVKDEEIAEIVPMRNVFKQTDYGFEELIDDIDLEQSEEFESHFDYKDDMASEEEEKLLDALFKTDGASIAKRLSDKITCVNKKEVEQDDEAVYTTDFLSETTTRFGKFMSLYTHGKMPVALRHTSRQEYWADFLSLTKPETWSPSAMFKATNIFFPQPPSKPDASSRTCTKSEAVIIGSIMQHVSIPEKFSSIALVYLAKLNFLHTTSYFIKVILEKKYSLPYRVIDAVTSHFLRFRKETRVMPVIWHQTLLSFVQMYKHELRKEDKKSLTSLILDNQNHKLITPEIVRELENSRNRGEKVDNISHSDSTMNNKNPIKEDLFDMPQVPMEED
ncbi:unnamed protein product [Cochlearia groenlandica]